MLTVTVRRQKKRITMRTQIRYLVLSFELNNLIIAKLICVFWLPTGPFRIIFPSTQRLCLPWHVAHTHTVVNISCLLLLLPLVAGGLISSLWCFPILVFGEGCKLSLEESCSKTFKSEYVLWFFVVCCFSSMLAWKIGCWWCSEVLWKPPNKMWPGYMICRKEERIICFSVLSTCFSASNFIQSCFARRQF